MRTDADIWMAAHLLIQRHGDQAEIIAAQRADEMLDRGDIEEQQIWLRIKRAIAELNAPATGKLN